MDREVVAGLERGDTVDQIAGRLYLSGDSIRWRVKQLGLSLRDGWRSRQEVGVVLGVGRRAVDRWMRSGDLRVARHGTRWTRVSDADLEACVRARAGLDLNVDAITDPGLRRLAETSAVANVRRRS